MSEHVFRSDELPVEPVGAAQGTARQLLTAPRRESAFHMRRFVMEPGGGMPPHTNRVEHQQLVLKGEATIGLGDEVLRIRAGDVVHIPAGLPHWYRAEGAEPFEFVCAVPNEEDEIVLLVDPPGEKEE